MPIYEYRCDACGETFEVLQKFSDEPIETCELCGGSVRKVLHPVAIHFKGSGFYTTDYARKSISSPSAEGKSDVKGADAGSDGGKGEGAVAGEKTSGEFRMSEKAKAENRQKRAEKAASAGKASSGKK